MIRATLTSLALAAAVLLAVSAGPAAAAEAGKVVSLEGTVEIGRGEAFARAVVGTAVQTGDTIRTGTPGRARVLFVDDSVLNLGDGTTLVVDETVFNASEGTASTLLRLIGGKVRALVSEYYSGGQGTYQIETTTAVSGVRGTEFIMAHDEATAFSEVLGLGGSTAVHGTVDRKNHGVVVHGNEITEIAKGKYPTKPRQITNEDERYRTLMDGLDLPGGGLPETLLLEDPAFGGDGIPQQDTADGNVFETPADGGPGTEPVSDLPPSAPGHAGGDLLDQPQPVLEAPTDVDVRF